MDQNLPNTSSQSSWPGEREPARHDVEVAHELPESAFLLEFKSCIMSDSEALGNESLMHLDLQVRGIASELRTIKYRLT